MVGSAAGNTLSALLTEAWHRDGVVVLPGLFDAQRAGELGEICERILGQWRECSAETGKPAGQEATVMRHLNHPGYFPPETDNERITFLDAVADSAVQDALSVIFDDRPLFRCTSLFFNPLAGDRDGNWHRDSQFHAPDEADERILLEERGHPGRAVQMQVALVPSDDVEYVPGSHTRWDTPEEYAIRRADGGANNRSSDMPGARRLHLQPGDAVCFNPMGLHRGRYHARRLRRTLMLTYTQASAPLYDRFSHQPWFSDSAYLDGVSTEARTCLEAFRDAYEPDWGKHPDGPGPRS